MKRSGWDPVEANVPKMSRPYNRQRSKGTMHKETNFEAIASNSKLATGPPKPHAHLLSNDFPNLWSPPTPPPLYTPRFALARRYALVLQNETVHEAFKLLGYEVIKLLGYESVKQYVDIGIHTELHY